MPNFVDGKELGLCTLWNFSKRVSSPIRQCDSHCFGTSSFFKVLLSPFLPRHFFLEHITYSIVHMTTGDAVLKAFLFATDKNVHNRS